MKLHADFNSIFEEHITSHLINKYGVETPELDADGNAILGLNIPVAYHSEYYYSSDTIADFSVCFIGGAIQQEVAQRPIQIICEVEEVYCDDVLQALDLTALEMNEKIIVLDGKEYRAYFNTPQFNQRFVEYGAKRRLVITCDASVILFHNILNIKKVELGYSATVLNEIKYSSLALAYTADTSSTGALNSTKIKNLATSNSNILTISYVPKRTSALDQYLMNMALTLDNANANIHIRITLPNLIGENTQYKYIGLVQSIGLTHETQSFPILQISLLRKDEWS